MKPSRCSPLSCVLVFVVLAGCTTVDPYRRPYAWHPVGANQANLAAMVADPRDLASGRSDRPDQATDAQAQVLAIEHVRQDKPKRLPVPNGIFAGSVGAGAAAGQNDGSSVSVYGY